MINLKKNHPALCEAATDLRQYATRMTPEVGNWPDSVSAFSLIQSLSPHVILSENHPEVNMFFKFDF